MNIFDYTKYQNSIVEQSVNVKYGSEVNSVLQQRFLTSSLESPSDRKAWPSSSFGLLFHHLHPPSAQFEYPSHAEN